MRCLMTPLAACFASSNTVVGERLSAPLLDDRGAGFVVLGPKAQPASKTHMHDEALAVVWKLTLETLEQRGVVPHTRVEVQ